MIFIKGKVWHLTLVSSVTNMVKQKKVRYKYVFWNTPFTLEYLLIGSGNTFHLSLIKATKWKQWKTGAKVSFSHFFHCVLLYNMVSLGEEQEEQPTSEKKKKNYVNKVEHLLKYYSTSKDVDFTVDFRPLLKKQNNGELWNR